MNVDTGEIRKLFEDEALLENEVLVSPDQMTARQHEEMRVSKFDNRSELGKLFTGNRKQRREQERERRREQKRLNRGKIINER
jgi:hypothetical protein